MTSVTPFHARLIDAIVADPKLGGLDKYAVMRLAATIEQAAQAAIRAEVCREEGHREANVTALDSTELEFLCSRCGNDRTEARPAQAWTRLDRQADVWSRW